MKYQVKEKHILSLRFIARRRFDSSLVIIKNTVQIMSKRRLAINFKLRISFSLNLYLKIPVSPPVKY